MSIMAMTILIKQTTAYCAQAFVLL